MIYYWGIDPGKSGAVSVLDRHGMFMEGIKLKETEHDVGHFFYMIVNGVEPEVKSKYGRYATHKAVIEKVHSFPRQGVSSTFKFGMSYGFLRGLLVAHKIPFKEVPPGYWQRSMRCLSKGDKNITKTMAQRLFPDLKVTHANADSLLIAEYARSVAWKT